MRRRSWWIRGGGALLGALLGTLPGMIYACESCFGAGVDSPTTQGISMAMLSLVVVTGGVLGGIGLFFVNIGRRARLLEPGDLVVSEDGDLRADREAE